MMALVLAQTPCPPEAMAVAVDASVRAQAFDMPGAIDRLYAAAGAGCADTAVGILYLRGLIGARDAFSQGAPPESLAAVRNSIDALEMIARGVPGPAEIARLMLQAAAAAAQSERDEMALYLDHAERMDSLLRAAGQPASPVLTAAEVSGELWLQVHRYEEARRAFERAAAQVGMTPRVVAGFARVAAAAR